MAMGFSLIPEKNTILVYTDPENCVPCARYEPVLKEVEKTHRIKRLDPKAGTMIPTTIIWVGGKEASRHIGYQSKKMLLLMPGVEHCEL
jgi:hypothetical protein